MNQQDVDTIEKDMQNTYLALLGVLHIILGLFYFFQIFDAIYGNISITEDRIAYSQRMLTLLPAAGIYFLGIVINNRLPDNTGKTYDGVQKIINWIIGLSAFLLLIIVIRENNALYHNVWTTLIYLIAIMTVTRALLTSNE